LAGAPILGANSASYTVSQVSQTNTGNYQVVVTNAAGAVTSAVATLSIAPPGVNLALNQPASSSTDQNNGLAASNVDDGSLTTRWSSAPGVDPSWVAIDLGSAKPFNTVILYWENAYASQYQIQYSNDQTNWTTAYTNNAGTGGIEQLTFTTVTARYVRMYGTQRATQYGYSLFEFQVYDVATCGGSTERYTLEGTNNVLDNVSGLTWQRAETTYTGADAQGKQYTQLIAQTYCSSVSMRLPTQAEALGISGASSASCAFPLPWSTWTSTVDPQNVGNAAFVTYLGQSSYQVADNFPGGVMCVQGASGVAPPTITTQPTAVSVAVGKTATFTVAATGTGTLSYQWYRNTLPITGANSASYSIASVAATDNGAQFSVTITNSGVSVVSQQVTLTVTGGSCTVAPTVPGSLTSTTTGATSIELTWTASTADATCPVSYEIFRSTTSGFTPSSTTPIGTAQSATYTDTGLIAGTTYYYVVEATDTVGTSAPSSQASALIPATGTAMPDFTLMVTPTAVSVAPGGTTTTSVVISPQNGFSANSAVTFTCSGLPAGTTCNFSAATSSSGNLLSSTLTINAAATAATWRAPGGLLLAGSPLVFGLFFVRRRGQRGGRWLMLVPLVAVALTMLAGCSKNTTTSTGGSTDSTVTVTATSGSIMHSTTFTLTVT
jgi:beta-galactosidase